MPSQQRREGINPLVLYLLVASVSVVADPSESNLLKYLKLTALRSMALKP